MDGSPVTQSTQAFFRSCVRQADDASAAAIEQRIRIGPWNVILRHMSRSTCGPYSDAFRHLKWGFDDDSDLTIYCIETKSCGFDLGAAPWARDDIGSMGEILGLDGSSLSALWDFQRNAIHMLDSSAKTGLIIIEDAEDLPGWEYTFPLRNLLHWHGLSQGCTMVHAGAVGTDNAAAVIVGVGGSGKSTTTIACTNAGLKMAGDDFILVDPSRDPCVYSLYSTAKLGAQSSAWFKGLHGKQTFDIGDDFEKNIFFVDALGAGRMCENLPLRLIVQLEKTGSKQSELVPCGAGEIFRACAANTIGLLPGHRSKTLQLLAQLSRSVSCCTFRIGTDLDDIGRKMAQKLEGMAR